MKIVPVKPIDYIIIAPARSGFQFTYVKEQILKPRCSYLSQQNFICIIYYFKFKKNALKFKILTRYDFEISSFFKNMIHM